MKLVVDSVLPLFALIFAGYLCGWRKVLGGAATDSLNLFVVWLALPALLFQAVAEVRWSQINHPGFVISLGGGMLATFALWVGVALAVARRRAHSARTRLPDASIEALAASYPNSGFLGIPLCLAVFGREGLHLVTISALVAWIAR